MTAVQTKLYQQLKPITQLFLNVLSEVYTVEDKDFAYFKVNIEPQFFNGSQSLIVKVQPQGYEKGDPDLFISKVNYSLKEINLYRPISILAPTIIVNGYALPMARIHAP